MENSAPKICSNFGCNATANVRSCARCGTAAYCSKECQREAWPKHKALCKMLSNLKRTSEEAENGTGSPQDVDRALARGMQGLVADGIIPDAEMPRGVPDGFPLIREASTEYISHRSERRQYGEGLYTKLYTNLVKNEREWMEFFEHPHNQSHAGDTSMVLEELARIHYERKSFEEMGGVLDMLGKTLHFCRVHCSDPRGDEGLAIFCERTEFGMLNLRYNMNDALGRIEENVPIFRDISLRELSPNYPAHEKRCFNQIWQQCLGLLNVWEGGNLRASSIHELSDELILKVIQTQKKGSKMINETDPAVLKQMADLVGLPPPPQASDLSTRDVQLKRCANCSKQEAACGGFRKCRNCKKVVYCSRPCQRQHWKKGKHSKVCRSA